MSPSLRHDLLAGAASGLLGGGVFVWMLWLQAGGPGQAGGASAAALALHLVGSVLVGAAFGGIFRYQTESYAFLISGGLLFGLLWWVLGPMTLLPLWYGSGPTWSLREAADAFPSLIGDLLSGGIMGVGFYILVTIRAWRHPEAPAGRASPEPPPTRIVILGGGFGGVSAAQHLERLLARERSVSVSLISESNSLLFTPLLAEVASSALEAQHISVPLRAVLPRTDIRRTAAEQIDATARVVWIRPSPSAPAEAVPYDHLVLAVGSVPNYHGLSGLEAQSFTLKTLEDAIGLRNHVIGLLERADGERDPAERRRQLTFLAVGGGFAGTEIIAELRDLVCSVLRYYPHIQEHEVRFMLVHGGKQILPELSPDLAAYALHKLRARGIEVLLNTRVLEAAPGGLVLSDGQRVATETLVWTAGVQPHPLVRTLPCEQSPVGAAVTTNTLQVAGLSGVWAVGDGAQIPDLTNGGRPCPPTAQYAVRQGIAAAANIVAALRGRRLRPFRFRKIGTLVGLGHHTAVAEIRGWKFSGLLAWFLWRTVYWSKLPGLERKVRVGLDWTIDLFFPRDIVLTTPRQPPGAGGRPPVGAETVAQRAGMSAPDIRQRDRP